MTATLGILGTGALSPVGLSAPATCAALRAGLARITEIGGYKVPGPFGDPIDPLGGRVPLEWLDGGPQPEAWPGHDRVGEAHPLPAHCWIPDGSARLARLAGLALDEALANANLARPPATWALLLALADGEPSPPIISVATAQGWTPRLIETVPGGRAAALLAVARAATLVAEQQIAGAVILAVDSRIRPNVLRVLDAAGALRHEHNPRAPHPGEGAAAILVGPGGPVRILAVGRGEEPTAGTTDPNQAAGLTAALRAAQRAASPALTRRPLCLGDLDGDRYRATEWAMASMRTVSTLIYDQPEDWTTADLIGDTGAAAGGLHLAWADAALRGGYAGNDRVLVWGAGDGRERAAVILGT